MYQCFTLNFYCPLVNAIREMTKITSKVHKMLVDENKGEEKNWLYEPESLYFSQEKSPSIKRKL